MPLQKARQYVIQNVIENALASNKLERGTKIALRTTRSWLINMPSVADLERYLTRAVGNGGGRAYEDLRRHNLTTFEDIIDVFRRKFADYLNVGFDITSLPIGTECNSYFVNILGHSYNAQSGGILVNRNAFGVQHVVIKCTLSGGIYPNEWLDQDNRLKFYMKSRMGNFNESYIENATIIKRIDVPIYAFVRGNKSERFIFAGRFRLCAIHEEGEAAKWFELVRAVYDSDPIETHEKLDVKFYKELERSKSDGSVERSKRLENASRKPKKIPVVTYVYSRNPDVVAQVLFDAKGKCAGCGGAAPFKRRKDNSDYLEVHHKIPLAAGGEDTVNNAVALCANCHRNEHFGTAKWPW